MVGRGEERSRNKVVENVKEEVVNTEALLENRREKETTILFTVTLIIGDKVSPR